MADPVFRLEGVIHIKGDTEDFEGPLSLILQLLSKNKIEIKDISVSLILEQYLEYLHEMERMDLEIASEFVAMASHLAYIKSRMLVADEDEEISELDQLISSLERLRRKDDYVKIKAMTQTLAEMFRSGSNRFVKPPEALPVNKEYRYSHDKADILNALMQILEREDGKAPVFHQSRLSMPAKVVYPVAEKAKEITDILRTHGTIKLADLFYMAKSRSELVAVFISVLEICKSGAAFLSGDGENTQLTSSGRDAIIEFDEYDRGDTLGDS